MELINNGYTMLDVFNLCKQVPLQYNRTNIFTNDLLLNYMLHLDIKDIKALCLIDKTASLLYVDKHLWQMKIEHHIHKFDFQQECNYIGECTYIGYQNVVSAINKIDSYNGLELLLTFKPDDNLLVWENLVDYDTTLYRLQQIKIHENTVRIECIMKKINKPDNIYKCKYNNINDLKHDLFNLFYYFPSLSIK